MKTILDTCVLSEIRHPSGSAYVKEAVMQIPDADLFLSVVSLGEISKGINLMKASKKRNDLVLWLNGLEANFAERIYGIDSDTAKLWGSLTARLEKTGIVIPAIDGLLAATALQRGAHLMTRNTRHFDATGALVIDPWQK